MRAAPQVDNAPSHVACARRLLHPFVCGVCPSNEANRFRFRGHPDTRSATAARGRKLAAIRRSLTVGDVD